MGIRFGKPAKAGKTILIFGSSGIGKTLVAGTSPDPTYFNFEEQGEETLETIQLHFPQVPAFDYKRLVTVDSTAEVLEALKKLEQKKPTDIKSLVFDSLSFLQQEKMTELLDDPARSPKHRRDELVWDDYDRMWIMMVQVMKKAPKLGYHVICTAQAEEKVDVKQQVNYWKPLISGKFQHLVAAYFSVVGFYHIVKVKGVEVRRLELRPSIYWPNVKVRRPDLLPEFIDNPTIPRILAYLNSSESDTEPTTEYSSETEIVEKKEVENVA